MLGLLRAVRYGTLATACALLRSVPLRPRYVLSCGLTSFVISKL